MLDLRGTELLPEEREMLAHPAAGGVILFTRNYTSPRQLYRLVAEIHELRSPALLVAVDQEGGRVQRFRDQLTRLPPAAWYGRPGVGREQALHDAREGGWLMAAELRALGVDFSFAPVLDVDRGVSSVIGDRAFGASPAQVAELALAWAHGAREAGMASVGKHFPGHGAVAADSHEELPVDAREFEDLWLADLVPFRRLIDNGLEGVMPAHVVYPDVDSRPAGFSRRWLRGVLRERLGFQGVIFSDDLSMAAAEVAGGYPERAEAALEAGCDMVLVCNAPEQAGGVLERLAEHRDPVAQSRLVRLHGKGGVPMARLHEETRWRRALARVAAGPEGDTLALDLD
jgi:beta-N-acetylhexosaminidase